MSFSKIYQLALDRQEYHKDDVQAKAVEQLDELYKELLRADLESNSIVTRLWKALRSKNYQNEIKGCYLSGDVGQGKTWLMDLFFSEAPVKLKLRFHFHEFMQQIHFALNEFKQQKDPLKAVAQSLVRKAKLFCLDEFHVSDIADAMLLHGLLDEMYRQGAIFVITSNVIPEDLYKNGLQRGRFLPAIDLLKQNNRILRLEGGMDYRLKGQSSNCNYYCPLNSDTDRLLEERFFSLVVGEVAEEGTISINNRTLQTRAAATNIVWFDFDVLCDSPRAAVDYIELSNRYNVVIISNLYRMDESHDDLARRFINLIDALYDRNVGIIISATAWPVDLYAGSRFSFEFTRTVSRLEDIRSKQIIQSTQNQGDSHKVMVLP